MYKKITCLALLYIFALNELKAQYCQPFPPSQALDPPLPNLPSSYEARIEINIDGKYSTNVRQFFDYNNRKAALIAQNNNIEDRIIYDYDTDEIHFVTSFVNQTTGTIVDGEPEIDSPKVCNTFKLTETDALNYFFGFQRVNDSYLEPDTVFHALNFLNFPFSYNNSYLIRGIPCDSYQSCQYIPETKSNFTVLYHFSRFQMPNFNFTMPFFNPDYPRVPVRAEYEGVRIVNGVLTPFREIHDFFEFRAGRLSRDSRDVFQTPLGVVCKNRKVSKSTPNITKQFSFSEEQVQKNTITYIKDLSYDSVLNAIRYERRDNKKEPETFYSRDPLITVHDYNVGVSFTYNRKYENCSITPIPFVSYDEDESYTEDLFNSNGSFVIRLKSPESFLLLNSDYIYTGRRISNNIPSESYISDRTSLNNNKTFISEYSFSSEFIVIQEEYATESRVPVSLRTFTQNNEQEEILESYSSFYNFKTSFTDMRVFDVSYCYKDNFDFDFRIRFPYKNLISASDLKDEVYITAFIDALLVAYTNETFTRFSRPQMSASEDGNFYLRAKILPPPPPLTLFTEVVGKWLVSNENNLALYYNLTLFECAAYCVAEKLCLSFDYIDSTILPCVLNKKHYTNEALTPGVPGYSHFSRNTIIGVESKPASQVYAQVQEAVKNSKFKLPVPVLSNPTGPGVILVADNIELIPFNDNRYGTTQILSKYNLKFGGKKFSNAQNRILLQSNIDDCARSCNEELGFDCKSFDFCFLSGDCRLSKNSITNGDQDFDESFDCDVYEKDSLFHYTEYPSKSAINKNDVYFSNVESPSECATKCDSQVENMHCRSFNYCPDSKKCYLSEKHVIDSANILNQDLVCTHYSRDYLSDFSYTSTAEIDLTAEIVYQKSSLELCSVLCSTADNFNCKSFDFCANSSYCLLSSDFRKKPSNSTGFIKTDTCANYKREYFFVTDQNKNAGSQQQNDNSSDILIGLSVTFAILGLIGGIVVIGLYIKRKQNGI